MPRASGAAVKAASTHKAAKPARKVGRLHRFSGGRRLLIRLVDDDVGNSGPPYGVPSWTACLVPSGITTAGFSTCSTSPTTRRSITSPPP